MRTEINDEYKIMIIDSGRTCEKHYLNIQNRDKSIYNYLQLLNREVRGILLYQREPEVK